MNQLLTKSKLFLHKNGPTILTCIGGVGVAATSIMAVKATPKALALLEEAKQEKGEELTKLEIVKVAGPVYIPSIAMGTATIACIFGANILNKHHQASLMSAYALLDNSYKEYKKKIEELYGAEANSRAVEELAKDHYEEDDYIFEEDNKKLFYDEFSKRYFESTMEDVLKAEYLLNRNISLSGYAYLNEFYETLGLAPVDYGDYLGWSSIQLYEMYWYSWVEFGHSEVELEDGLECCIITIGMEPTCDFTSY